MSDPVTPHRWQPTRLHCPWDSPGKNTGVGCHFLLQCMKVKSKREVAQSCPTLRDPMDCSPPGPSVLRIFQARILEWIARGNSVRLYFFGAPKSLQMVTAAMKLKMLVPWKKSYHQPRQYIKKRQSYFANKGPSSQGYGLSSSHVWM